MAVNHPNPGKQPPPLTKKLISSVVGTPANKSNQASKQPLKGMDALVTLLPTKEATPAPPPPVVDSGQVVDQSVSAEEMPRQSLPIRAVGECEASYQAMVSMDLLDRNIDMEASREVAKVLLAGEAPADNKATPEEATIGTDAMMPLTPLSTHHAYSSKHQLQENEIDMTQQEQTQTQETKQVGPFLNITGHTAAVKYFDDEVIAKLDTALVNYGAMSPHGFAESYDRFKEDIKMSRLEGSVPTYLSRYCSNIAFIELAGKIDESNLHRTAITSGIRAINASNHFGQPCSSEIASANSVRCAWDVVDAVAYASAIVNICNRWIYSVDPTMTKTIDFSEVLLDKGVHTAVIEQRDAGNFHENAASYRKSQLKQAKSIENTSRLILELVEVSEKLLQESETGRTASSMHDLQQNFNSIDELQNAVAMGIALLSDAINFMTTSTPRFHTNGANGHYWLTNPDANIHMCVTVDENYLVSVELNLYIQDELKLAMMQQEAIFDEALMVHLPGDVSINASIMDSLKKAMMDAYIAGRQSAKPNTPKPTFGPEQGANVSAMREGLKRVRYSSTAPGGAGIQLQAAPNTPHVL